MKTDKKSILLALLAVLFWSTIGSAFKLTLDFLNYTQILLFASFVAVVFLGSMLLINGRWAGLKQLTLKEVGLSAVMGLLNPFAYYLILLKAYSLLQAQEAVALNYIWPMILVLLSIPVLKQRITLLNIFALIISFFGTLVIATGGRLSTLTFTNPLGTGLALVSALFWASYWLLNMKDKRETTEKLFLNFGFGFFYALIYTIVTKQWIWPGFEGSLGVIYIGLFEMGITFVIWLKALKYAENTAKVSNLVYLSPFISLFFVNIFVGEKILWSTIAGLSLIIGGILLQHVPSIFRQKPV
ncbi:MAG: DMT family transporter [Lentimicrobium sp.]|jgi:drug/metabolite transporter (DMT)-like permease|nr:DMT family transporter [Lentimicrobium sp.]